MNDLYSGLKSTDSIPEQVEALAFYHLSDGQNLALVSNAEFGAYVYKYVEYIGDDELWSPEQRIAALKFIKNVALLTPELYTMEHDTEVVE